MPEDGLPQRLVLPSEPDIDRQIFERLPVYAVMRFLECFDTLGEQKYAVPRHTLEELARRFLRLMYQEVNSLDVAFGGKVARQRNAIEASETAFPIIWDVICEQEAAKRLTPFERSMATPLQCAFRAVAEARGMSPSNVERIWKDARRGY